MINGIDPQHLQTVHKIAIDMDLTATEDETQGLVDFTLSGELPAGTLKERAMRGLFGNRYSYRMRYSYGTLGFLTVLKDTYWFGGQRAVPELFMIFAYRPEGFGKTFVQPIYVARRGSSWGERLLGKMGLLAMKLGFYALRDEDGEIYENMRFRPASLLPMDAPVAKFIRWVNRLKPSIWSEPQEV